MTRGLVFRGLATLAGLIGGLNGGPGELLAGEDSARYAASANNDFAFDLYSQLAKQYAGKNLFFSPCSISIALTIMTEGARGQTAMEMGKVLRFPEVMRQTGTGAELMPWRMPLVHRCLADLRARIASRDDEAAQAASRIEIARLRKEFGAAEAIAHRLQGRPEYAEARQAAEQAAARLNEALAKVDQYEIFIANALWAEKTCPLLDEYVNTIAKYYKTAGVFQADFKSNYPAERVRINKWIEDKTNKRISDLVPERSAEQASLLRLVLTNAIYFKGEWSVPFGEAAPRAFTLAGGEETKTPIMQVSDLKVGRYGAFNADGSVFDTPVMIRPGQTTGLYPDKKGFAMVEMPYKGDGLSMVLLVPVAADGLAAVEKKLTPAALETLIARLRNRQTHVLLPKFKLQTGCDMKPALQAMGMVRAFEAPGSPKGASFIGMCASRDPAKRLYIWEVLHKAFVEVNETGTEIVGVTVAGSGIFGDDGRRTAPRIEFFTPVLNADHPFLFIIRDIRAGCILFMGRVMDPRENTGR
jgi:serine protease inhibitor